MFNDQARQRLFLYENLVTFVLLAVLMAIQIVNYLVADSTFTVQAEWTKEITAKCGAEALNGAFMAKSLEQTASVAIGIGAYYGLVIESYVFKGQTLLKNPESGNAWKAVIRVLPVLLLILVAVSFYLLFNNIGITNQVLLFVFG